MTFLTLNRRKISLLAFSTPSLSTNLLLFFQTQTMTTVTCSPSLADIRALQADNLDRLRDSLQQINIRDVVPLLVARNVLRSYEMGALYAKGSDEQVDALIDLLKTKNHWVGPLTDALIRNGKAPIAKILLELQNGK
ncbi:hypothetical protein CRE_06005 [Caenorhabditis remanei]|uniref:CARD domain-containing protein n=2 Tax=Caenorhabditis remanei TaxID=31234 RepID=E3N6F8_CAERE|nr:hypothetical protein CRE_06005 [Caenorhabditis remanei]